MKTELVQYFRKKNGQAIGVFYASVPEFDNTKFTVGFSLCNTRKDKFEAQAGLYLASERAQTPRKRKIPASMVSEFNKFFDRAQKYFKDKQFNGVIGYEAGVVVELDCPVQ